MADNKEEIIDLFDLGSNSKLMDLGKEETPADLQEEDSEIENVEEEEESFEDPLEEVIEEDKEETSEEIEEEPEFGEYASMLQDLIDDGFIDYDGETEYEDSKDGFKRALEEAVEKKAQEKLEEYKSSFGEDKEFLEMKEKGLSLEEYIQMKNEFDYSLVPLEREGKDLLGNQEKIIYDFMKKVKNLDDEEIEDFISFYKEKGNLKENAEKAKDKLVEWKTEKDAKLVEQREKAIQEENELREAEAKEFKEEVLNLNEIAGFKITKKEANELHDFITKPVDKDGNTAFKMKDSKENRLLYAYFAMKNFNKEALAKEERKKAILKVKKELNKPSDSTSQVKGSSRTINTNDEAVKPSQFWTL